MNVKAHESLELNFDKVSGVMYSRVQKEHIKSIVDDYARIVESSQLPIENIISNFGFSLESIEATLNVLIDKYSGKKSSLNVKKKLLKIIIKLSHDYKNDLSNNMLSKVSDWLLSIIKVNNSYGLHVTMKGYVPIISIFLDVKKVIPLLLSDISTIENIDPDESPIDIMYESTNSKTELQEKTPKQYQKSQYTGILLQAIVLYQASLGLIKDQNSIEVLNRIDELFAQDLYALVVEVIKSSSYSDTNDEYFDLVLKKVEDVLLLKQITKEQKKSFLSKVFELIILQSNRSVAERFNILLENNSLNIASLDINIDKWKINNVAPELSDYLSSFGLPNFYRLRSILSLYGHMFAISDHIGFESLNNGEFSFDFEGDFSYLQIKYMLQALLSQKDVANEDSKNLLVCAYEYASNYAHGVDIDFSKLVDKYNNKETILLPSGWTQHYVSVVLYNGYIAIVNRGAKYDESEQSGINIYKLNDDSNLVDKLSGILQLSSSPDEYASKIKALVSDKVAYIKLSPQKSGNCTHSNLKSALLAADVMKSLTLKLDKKIQMN